MFRSMIAAMLIVPLLALSTVTPCQANTGLHGDCGMAAMHQKQQPSENTQIPAGVAHRCCDQTPVSSAPHHSVAKPCCCLQYLAGEAVAALTAPSYAILSPIACATQPRAGHAHRIERPPQS